jgi:hypothetical protein
MRRQVMSAFAMAVVAWAPAADAETLSASSRCGGRPVGEGQPRVVRVEPGCAHEGFRMTQDGKVFFNGRELFSDIRKDPASAGIMVSNPSPGDKYAYVTYYDGDWGGLQSAIVSLQSGTVPVAGIPESFRVRGIGAPADVEQVAYRIWWSPNGRYALTFTEAFLIAIDAETGRWSRLRYRREEGPNTADHHPDAVAWPAPDQATATIAVSCHYEAEGCDQRLAKPYTMTVWFPDDL